MEIPDNIRKCVAYVGYENDGIPTIAGTCFFVFEFLKGSKETYIVWCVTARHSIDKIQRVRTSLGDKQGQMFVRMNLRSGGTRDFPLDVSYWRFHDDPAHDAAVMLMGFEDDDDHLTFPIDQTALQGFDRPLGIGSELFIVGLFKKHVPDRRNVPIVRLGNIAAMPEVPIKTQMGEADLYLIEARSSGGLSGSPVFVSRNGYVGLLGLVHGHYDDHDRNERINLGIAMVTPIEVVAEIMNYPEFDDVRTLATEGETHGATTQ